jgi:hypothetical protein
MHYSRHGYVNMTRGWIEQGWITEIRKAILFATENELMFLAEMIISDEQYSQTQRLQQ